LQANMAPGFTATHQITVLADDLEDLPSSMAVDSRGFVYYAEYFNNNGRLIRERKRRTIDTRPVLS